MADFRRRSWTTRTRPSIAPRNMIDEEISPSTGWTHDFPGFHCLFLNLPGFEKDDIKLNFNESGSIVVSGRRKVEEGKQKHFEKSFSVPEDGDIKSISMIFDGDTLRVRIPKVSKTKQDEPKNINEASSSGIKDKDKKESNIPALDSSKEDVPGESKSLASSRVTKEKESESLASGNGTNEKKEITSTSSNIEDSIKEFERPAVSSDTKETKEEEHKSPNEEENTEKPNEDQKEKTDGDQEKKSSGQGGSKVKEDNLKEDEKSAASGVTKEKQRKSPQAEESTEKLNEYQKERNDGDQGETSSKASVLVKIIENKGILIASIISFTLGVLMSQKMHPSSPPK